MKNFLKKASAGLAVLIASGAAMATPPPTAYDGIVSAVDWSDVVTGIGAIAALIAAVFIVRKGARMLLSFLR